MKIKIIPCTLALGLGLGLQRHPFTILSSQRMYVCPWTGWTCVLVGPDSPAVPRARCPVPLALPFPLTVPGWSAQPVGSFYVTTVPSPAQGTSQRTETCGIRPWRLRLFLVWGQIIGQLHPGHRFRSSKISWFTLLSDFPISPFSDLVNE